MVNQKIGRPFRTLADMKRRYAAFHGLTSETTVLDLLVFMAMAADDSTAPQVVRAAQLLGVLLEHIVGSLLCNRLRMCGAALSTPCSAEAVRHLLRCMLTDVCNSKGIHASLSHHALAAAQ